MTKHSLEGKEGRICNLPVSVGVGHPAERGGKPGLSGGFLVPESCYKGNAPRLATVNNCNILLVFEVESPFATDY